MMDEVSYEIDCAVCEVVSEVVVKDNQEEPAYCPMCGSPVEIK
jgi:rRNA maturation endonuclease Nob1